jgi:hypothetical protein
MALPSLNASPAYELTVPSTGEQLKFRPFLVKEQKILMLANESQDKKQIINAMLNTITSCVDGADTNNLTTFDVDYIFTQIRAKSVGEKIEFKFPCKQCESPNETMVNLEELKMGEVKGEKIVELNDKVSVKLKYPSYSNILRSMTDKVKSETEMAMDVIIACMDSVLTDEENISLKHETKDEINKFVDSMSGKQFEEVSKFVQDMPQLEHTVKFNCVSCGHQNKLELKGLDDFF